MSEPADLQLPVALDPDLEALPEPRRPGRRLTIACMSLTLVLALLMAYALRGQASYALRSGPPTGLGNLTDVQLQPSMANTWVQGDALLATEGAIGYGRPLDSDSYRLARVAGHKKLWVEVRVPKGMEGPRFVPPASFVGRLVPLTDSGLRHNSLDDAVRDASSSMDDGAWLLVDGDSPRGSRWAIALIALFAAFAAFNIFGLFRILRPVKDA